MKLLSSQSLVVTRNLNNPELIVKMSTVFNTDWYWSVRLISASPNSAIFSVLEYDKHDKSYKPEIEYVLFLGNQEESSKAFLYLTPSSYCSTYFPINYGVAMRVRAIVSETIQREPGKRFLQAGDVVLEIIPGSRNLNLEIKRGESYKRLYTAIGLFSDDERKSLGM